MPTGRNYLEAALAAFGRYVEVHRGLLAAGADKYQAGAIVLGSAQHATVSGTGRLLNLPTTAFSLSS